MRILFLLCLFSHCAFAQSFNLEQKAELNADQFIGFDSYKHIYYIKDDVLHKKGDLGNFVFRDFQLGPITSVDIINPLNVVVFYAQMNTVVLLDSRLNETERINFNDLPSFLNISMALNAGNNKLWIFKIDTQQLELYHYRNQLQTVVSQPFKGMVQSHASNFNVCSLLTENYIRKFNVYGSLLLEIPNEGIEKLFLYNEILWGIKENKLYKISQEAVKTIPFPLEEKPIKDLQLTQDFLYIYDGKTLYTYTLTQPKQ